MTSQENSHRALALLLAAVAVLELTTRFTDARAPQHAAWAAMILAIVLSVRRLGLREIYLVTSCAALAGLTVATQSNWQVLLGGALDQGTFLMAFILLLGLLQACAATSPSVATVGAFVTQQPPGRRYLALHGGSSVLAILFNIGVVSFLVPLIQRGVYQAAPNDPLNPIREQRQLSALLRGFAWSVTWSPTAIAPLIVADLIPGVERLSWMGYGLALFGAVMAIGWLEDRIRFRAYQPRGLRPAMAFPRQAAMRFVATTGWFLVLVVGFARVFDESIVFGVLAACPVMMVGWLAAQHGLPRLGTRVSQMIGVELPGSVNIAITLAASGFIGRAAAGLIPSGRIAEALQLAALPDWMLLALLPPVLTVVSLLALSPTMIAVFIGSFFAALPVMPADPTLIAFSISCSWALSMTFSPFATVVLVMSRGSGVPVRTLTWAWNSVFTLIAAALLVPVFYFLTGGQ